MIIAPLGISPGDARFPRRGGRAYTHHSRRWSKPHRADPIAHRVSAPSCRPGGSRTRCHSGTPVCAAVGGPVSAAALEQTLRLASPHRPPRGTAVSTGAAALCPCGGFFSPLHPLQGLCGSLATPGGKRLRRSCRCPSVGVLSPCPASHCTAAGLLRQGPASRRARVPDEALAVAGGPCGGNVPPRPSCVAALPG